MHPFLFSFMLEFALFVKVTRPCTFPPNIQSHVLLQSHETSYLVPLFIVTQVRHRQPTRMRDQGSLNVLVAHSVFVLRVLLGEQQNKHHCLRNPRRP